jgi:hypothetical protein
LANATIGRLFAEVPLFPIRFAKQLFLLFFSTGDLRHHTERNDSMWNAFQHDLVSPAEQIAESGRILAARPMRLPALKSSPLVAPDRDCFVDFSAARSGHSRVQTNA